MKTVEIVLSCDFVGEYFIDRDPKYFDRILEYLRSGKFSWGGLDSTAKQKLLKDLDYYQISLPDKVEPDNKDSELPQEVNRNCSVHFNFIEACLEPRLVWLHDQIQ